MSLLLLGVSRPGFIGVIDAVGTSAEVAYSTARKLRAGYTGNAFRVRRSSDNAEQDIGFVNNEVDTASLLTFCGAGNGFVVTLYDQSGNVRDVTQATAGSQPQCVGSGALLTRGGKLTAVYDGGDSLAQTAFTMVSQTVNAVVKANSLVGVPTIWRQNTGVESALRFNGTAYQYYRSPGGVPTGAGTPGTTNARVMTAVANTGTTTQLWADGASQWTFGSGFGNGASTGAMSVGASPTATEFFIGDISEVIIFSSNLTIIQRGILEGNQGLFYSIASLGSVQWANTYQASNPSTASGVITDKTAADETTYEEVAGGVSAVIGMTAVQNIAVARGFTAFTARVYVTDSITYVVDRWNGSAWVADIVTSDTPPFLSGGGEWVSLSMVLDAAKTTTKVRLSVQTQGSGIASVVRIGDMRIS